MSTISSNLPLPDAQSALGRSLADLSANARPAGFQGSDADDTGIGEDQYVGPALQVAQQNRFAALTDPESAAAATQSAASSIGSQSESALGVQANVSGAAAWGLLQID